MGTKIRSSKGAPYSYEFERKDDKFFWNTSIYHSALDLEEGRIFELNGLTPKKALRYLSDEIKLRVRITKLEIFTIGYLLHLAKKFCQQAGRKFKDWIERRFDFSYETAINFMNVYKYCFGHREVALLVPTSILYKISTPNFPEELREYLFRECNLEKMTNGEMKDIIIKYREGGLKAVENDLERIEEEALFDRHIRYTIDQCNEMRSRLKSFCDRIYSRGKGGISMCMPFEVNYSGLSKEAFEINRIIYEGVEKLMKDFNELVANAIGTSFGDEWENRIGE